MMKIFDFFKKQSKKGSQPDTNQASASGTGVTQTQTPHTAANTQTNRLMNKMYQESRQRAQTTVTPTAKVPRNRREPKADGEGLRGIRELFDMEGHRMPDITGNKAYGLDDEDFALFIPQPEPDAEKARKLYEFGIKEIKNNKDVEELGTACYYLFCSYMFGYAPALKEYTKLRNQIRARYRSLSGKTDDYILLSKMHNPAQSHAIASAYSSDHFKKVWTALDNSDYGRNLKEDWDCLIDSLRIYKVPGPKSPYADYSKNPLALKFDIERIWAGIREEVKGYFDRDWNQCPIDANTMFDEAEKYNDKMVSNLLTCYTTTLFSVNAIFDKAFEAVWENPLYLFYNFGEL